MDAVFVGVAAAVALAAVAVLFALMVMTAMGQLRARVAALEKHIEHLDTMQKQDRKARQELGDAGSEVVRRLNMLANANGYYWSVPQPFWAIAGKPESGEFVQSPSEGRSR